MDEATSPSLARTTLRAALLGALSGGRAAAPLAQLAKHAGSAQIAPWRAFGRPVVRRLLRLSMWAELVMDKLPGVPSRLAPPSLAGRCVSGAIAGATVFAAGRRPVLVGALIGSVAAYLGARLGYALRTGHGASDAPHRGRGLIEDAIVVGASSRVARAAVASTALPSTAAPSAI